MAMSHSLPSGLGTAPVTFTRIVQSLELRLAVAVILRRRVDASGVATFVLSPLPDDILARQRAKIALSGRCHPASHDNEAHLG